MSDHVSEDDMGSIANRNERTKVANVAPADVNALVANNGLGRDVGAMHDIPVTDSFINAQRNAEELQKKVDSDAKQISALQEEKATLLANEQKLSEALDWYRVQYEQLTDDSDSLRRALRVLSPRLRLIAETIMVLPKVHRAMLYESIGVVSRDQYDDALSSMADDYDKDMSQFRQEVDMRNYNTSDTEQRLSELQSFADELQDRLSTMQQSHEDTIAKMTLEMNQLEKENTELDKLVQDYRAGGPPAREADPVTVPAVEPDEVDADGSDDDDIDDTDGPDDEVTEHVDAG